MFATRQNLGPVNAEANRFLFELEQEFDLMRLRARRALLGQKEARLAEEQEFLWNDLRLSVVSSAGTSEVYAGSWLCHAVAMRVSIWSLECRRAGLAGEMRRLVLLEEDIEFALRLRIRQSRG